MPKIPVINLSSRQRVDFELCYNSDPDKIVFGLNAFCEDEAFEIVFSLNISDLEELIRIKKARINVF